MKFYTFILFCVLFSLSGQVAMAQFTVLPETTKSYQECGAIINNFLANGSNFQTFAQGEADNLIAEKQKVKDAQKALDLAIMDKEASKEDFQASKKNEDLVCNGKGNDDKNCKIARENTFQHFEVVNDKSKKLDEAKKVAENTENQAQTKFSAAGVSYDNTDFSLSVIANERTDVLGCAIKTGRISLSMIPYFVTYITNFLLGLSGLISLLFTVLGGYYYVFGGISEDKDKGKKTIMYAAGGLALALLAWTLVNVIIQAVTAD